MLQKRRVAAKSTAAGMVHAKSSNVDFDNKIIRKELAVDNDWGEPKHVGKHFWNKYRQ